MTKGKKSAVKPAAESSVSDAGAAAHEEKKQQSMKRSRDEIDEIFASKKKQNKHQNAPAKRPPKDSDLDKMTMKKNTGKRNKSNSGSRRENSGSFSAPQAAGGVAQRQRKRTGDGLAVYTEEELGIGKSDAGGTPLCPFDCDCCF